MPGPNMDAPLQPCVTVDATQNDGYLDNVRAGSPPPPHDYAESAGTAAAAANLLFCNGPAASLVGHGAEGDIDTWKETGECMTIANQDDWEPELARLHGVIQSLTLYSCCVGGGALGAALLQKMANATGASVSAPTGLIYCDEAGNFTLEDGAVWNTVLPNNAPNAQPPAPPPAPPSPLTKPMPSNILNVNYRSNAGAQVSGTAATAIAKEVVWTPFKPPGEPGAKVTGKLFVTSKGPAGQPIVTDTYLVLAHRLLRNENDPEIFFQTTAKFQNLVRNVK